MRVLVTGGAGFVGANCALGLATRHPDWEVTALDNLRRRGAELNLERLRAGGVRFAHGDVRQLEDLLGVEELDALVECSAEPSALAGIDGDPDYVIRTNLFGAYHCLELARRRSAFLLFLSTSRVYPVPALRGLALAESQTRLELERQQPYAGASEDGIAESFPLAGPRTIYGSTKLAAEMLIEEYRAAYGLRAVVDRCGVIAGPWQMGKVDQGVFTYWMLAHHFKRPLAYIGFGGHGKQVRDLLHVEDLIELIDRQLGDPRRWDGETVNVGGGRGCSLSLREATALCAEITGNRVELSGAVQTRPGDVPLYISDCSRLAALTDWRPQRGPREILADVHRWIHEHETAVQHAL
ncbi:MAG: NAD-dependent epimerase/dehydratase family protein [Solirubrobacterales bacterium]|nr:NAD-dependent epimerase/dehydratase family protein [Solirubrobacterales bacterium]